jgi:hypothetical protein
MEGTCGSGTEPRHNFGEVVIVTSELFSKGDVGVETGTGRCFPWWDWDQNEVRLPKPVARTIKDSFCLCTSIFTFMYITYHNPNIVK